MVCIWGSTGHYRQCNSGNLE